MLPPADKHSPGNKPPAVDPSAFRTVRPTDDPTDHADDRTAAYEVEPELPMTVTSVEISIPDPEDVPPPVSIPGYKVQRVLGEGAMGVVYKAVQTGLKRTVALKMVLGDRPPSKLDLARFLSEAEALASVSHPNVVPVYDAGQADGKPYLAMEFLPGGNLERWAKDESRAGGRIDPKEAARAVVQVARGVAAVHAIGIVHRDLKPQNVLIAADGGLKVADFGLAKRGGSELTHIGAVMGTPAYMSPEQARGRTKFVGPQCDVWAVGVILYEILTGRRPFDAEDPYGLLAEIATTTPAPPRKHRRNIPKDLERIIVHCMAREPEGRYPTAAELAADLDRYLAGEPILAHTPGLIERVSRWVLRHPSKAAAWVFGLTAVGATVVGGSLAFLWLRAVDARQVADSARQVADSARDALAVEKQQTEMALAAEQVAKRKESEARQKADEAAGREREAAGREREAAAQARLATDQLRESRYGHTVSLAHFEYRDNHLARARELLAEARPTGGGWEWDYLNRVCNGHALKVDAKAGRANAVAYTAGGGGRLVSAHADGTVRVWDSATGKPVRVLPARDKPAEVANLASSEDGRRVVAAGADGSVRLWDANADEPPVVLRPAGPRASAAAVAVPADGTAVAAGGADGVVTVWNPADPTAPRTIAAKVGAIAAVGYSPDGRWLAVGGEEGGVKVWENGKDQPVTFPGETAVAAVAVTADAVLAVGLANGVVRLYDVAARKPLGRPFQAHTGGVWAMAYSPDGRTLATGGPDRAVRLWGGRSGEPMLVFRGHEGEVRGLGFDPAGRRVASAGADGSVRVWDLARPPEGWILETDCGRVNALAAAGSRLAVAGLERVRVATVGDAGPDEATWTGPRPGADARPDPGRSAAEGELAVRFGGDALWVVSARGELAYRSTDDPSAREEDGLPLGGPVSAAAFAPDRDVVAVGRAAGGVAVWDAKARKEVASWPAHSAPVRAVAFGPGGVLVTGAADGGVKFWDADARREVKAATHGPEVLAAAVGPDGKLAATGSADHTARVWDAKTGAEVWTLRGHLGGVAAVGFSPDGRRVATGGRDGQVKVWDVATGYELLTLPTGLEDVTGVAFSPDGKLLYAGKGNGRVRIFSGKPTAGGPGPNE